MKIRRLHSWDVTPSEAVALQRKLAGQVDVSSPLGDFCHVAGADISYDRHSSTLYAGVVVLKLPELNVVERRSARTRATFPYVPGLLSFREIPALLAAFEQVETQFDVVACDGQGLAHPRRFGLACHLGLWLDVSCLGCAKSRLVGEFEEPASAAGSISPLHIEGEIVGSVVRTRDRVKPVFVSAGHRIDLASAVRVVLACGRGYRIPEPTRLADQYVETLRRGDTDPTPRREVRRSL
jgi:deoxyribonuclease V